MGQGCGCIGGRDAIENQTLEDCHKTREVARIEEKKNCISNEKLGKILIIQTIFRTFQAKQRLYHLKNTTYVFCDFEIKNQSYFGQNSLAQEEISLGFGPDERATTITTATTQLNEMSLCKGVKSNENLKEYKYDKKFDDLYVKSDNVDTIISKTSGSTYIGGIHQDQKQGRGTFRWRNGSIYEGYWDSNKATGPGRMIIVMKSDKNYDYCNIYEGQWKNSKANGFGVYTCEDGSEYKGNWRNNRPHGLGHEVLKGQFEYEGEYKYGIRHGKGTVSWTSTGDRYTGEFINDQVHGFGEYTYSNGNIYKGEWKEGLFHGEGVFQWGKSLKVEAKEYSGQYINGKKHGIGVFKWADGRIYKGYWSEGKQHGLGIFIGKGHKTYGNWEQGKRIETFTEQEALEKNAEEFTKIDKFESNNKLELE
ncbi:unnamed protein product [Moneuplotes crassus]|uniref:MORN repeat protein n=1 Tax=Euplotes crassus TaxID=5936 RepID=A0AAD1XDV4_EUPCR|nr:unnamed protein product [Moneuplotes crassus]